MGHAVVLEHTTPGGGSHFDWMIEDGSLAGERRLRTWRLEVLPFGRDAFRGERIGDHRAEYLRFEGDIGGGRGSVRRVERGRVEALMVTDSAVEARIRWEQRGVIGYAGRADASGGGAWTFVVSGVEGGGDPP